MAAPGPQQQPSTPPSSSFAAASAGTRTVPEPAPQGWQRVWQTRGLAALALRPVSLLYGALVRARRQLYRGRILRSAHPGRPVVVVGNVIAGGAGKTPVVMALVRHLRNRGLRVGVISRGYGRTTTDCRAVLPDSSAAEVGDEPALIARSFAHPDPLPMFVARQRIAAARALLAAHPDTDVIVCDDGLQHLALKRDVEICVFNSDALGNGLLLPAGPLREPWPRPVDFVLHAGLRVEGGGPAFALHRQLAPWAVRSDGSRQDLSQLIGQPLHAVAGVARPADFFAMLTVCGLTLEATEPLPDHYDFSSWKRLPDKRLTLICTEKDAAKLWEHHPDALAVPLHVGIAPEFFEAFDERLGPLLHGPRSPAPPLSSRPS